MAANEITFKIKVEKDGTLGVVAKDAEKAAKATDKLGTSTDKTTKARNNFSKGEKGVAVAGMNSTKAFSKMNQAMVGGGGLVGAYATLAANVFALTAAFGVLQRAAAAQQLAEGLAYTGTVAGRNLPYIADRLREITGEAVSTAEAMNQVALASASGFSSEQIQRLGEVAKGASLALGRDTVDSLNRLTRGAAKLEPELLDELGIMVRLDDAATKYATAIGTTADNLTQFQKRQAFVNAVIEQGEKSFSGIADAIEPNAYDQLAAALSDLLKNFVTFLNKGLIPVAKFFSKSPTALLGGILLFSSTIRSQLLPGMTSAASAFAEFAAQQAAAAGDALTNIETTGKLPKVYGELSSKLQEGTATTKDYERAQRSLGRSVEVHTSQIQAGMFSSKEEAHLLAEKVEKLEHVKNAQQKLNAVGLQTAKANTAQASANTILSASNLNVRDTFKNISIAMAQYRVQLAATALANGAASVSFAGLRTVIFGLTLSIKALGIGLLAALPYLALIPVAIGLIKAAWDKFFGDSETVKRQNEIIASLSHLSETGFQLQETLRRLDDDTENTNVAFDKMRATITATAGQVTQIRDRLKELAQVETSATVDQLSAAYLRLNELEAKRAGQTGGDRNRTANQIIRQKNAIDELRESLGKVSSGAQIAGIQAAIAEFETSGGSEEEIQRLRDQIGAIQDATSAGKILRTELDKILNPPSVNETTNQLLESARAGLNKVNEELAKLSEKTTTPFDSLIDGLAEIEKATGQTEKSTGKLTEAAQRTITVLNADQNLTKILKKFGVEADSNTAKMKKLALVTKEQRDIIAMTPEIIKKEQAELDKLKILRGEIGVVQKQALVIEESIRTAKLNSVQAHIKILEALGLDVDQSTELNKLKKEETALLAEKKSVQQEGFLIAQSESKFLQANLAMERKITAAAREQLDLRKEEAVRAAKAKAFADPLRRSTTLTAKEEKAIQLSLLKAEEKIIKDEFRIKRIQVKIEFDLLNAKFAYLKAEAAGNKEALRDLETYEKLIQRARVNTVLAINASEKSALANAGNTTDLDARMRTETMAGFGEGASTGERLVSGLLAGGKEGLEQLNESEIFSSLFTALEPMIERLKSLGPEGTLIASMVQGTAVATQSWLAFGDTLTSVLQSLDAETQLMMMFNGGLWENLSDTDKYQIAAAGFAAIASSIGMLSSVMAAASANRVAGIDAEIAAEKKRDGQSAQSVAKLKALEKKKDAEKRKAFETNKKLMMAQIIASTAAGVMGAMAIYSLYEFPIALVTAGIIAAMGAASLAVVAGTSYQGGGGGGAPSGPSSISMGQRRSSVDLASAQSPRGEISYMRGDRGMGGPENFQPAFYGRKNRNYGGSAGYMVGEQGPELFMPDRPGTIIPADDTAALGSPANVTFNINTIDASGVEDVLMAQQGNIIGMLRTAANSYGEDFFESVDESVYTTPAVGRA